MAVRWGWCPGYGRVGGGGMRGWLRTAALGWGLRAQTGVEKCLQVGMVPIFPHPNFNNVPSSPQGGSS